MMEHSQVEMMVEKMVALMVSMTAYYWVGLKATMKVVYSVDLMDLKKADYSAETMDNYLAELWDYQTVVGSVDKMVDMMAG